MIHIKYETQKYYLLKQHKHDSTFDLCAHIPNNITIMPKKIKSIHTGIKLELPPFIEEKPK